MIGSLRNKFEHFKVSEKRGQNLSTTLPKLPPAKDLDRSTIYKYRYNYGVNLGALFVLEPWIFSKETICTIDGKEYDSEFDAISQQLKKHSSEDVAKMLSDHYKKYIDRIDWEWLSKDAHITALRIPIGYWHVEDGKHLDSLPFAPLRKVYELAKPWEKLGELINNAKKMSIGVLIDLHGLPGGANCDSHSGSKSGEAAFFHKEKYMTKVYKDILPAIINTMTLGNENIIGIQVVNEACFDNNPKGQKFYYSEAINTVEKLQPGLPVIISDGWWPQQWADWVKEKHFSEIVVIDSHVYRCFSDSDKSKDANSIIKDLPNTVNFPHEDADYTVGEFSGVLDGQTWNKTSGDRDAIVQKYVQTQADVFSHVASWGWFFWTLQFEYGDGGEWGLAPMMQKGNLPKRPHGDDLQVDKKKIDSIIHEHEAYWNGKGKNFEHWRFEDGIKTAVDDIIAFRKFDNSLIGRWHSWKSQRRAEYVSAKKDSEFMWEWDQGYQRGLDEFNKY
ncbi:hypothetical protein H812_YJM1401B00157 [Saccharomyces cerevisiae YJM1401]|nr:hypothetical protein H812_YJM1401B00157 [Saccharomyces cerevisiae YJM1401]